MIMERKTPFMGTKPTEMGTVAGVNVVAREQAGRMQWVYNKWQNVESMLEDALERECMEIRKVEMEVPRYVA
jgi:hypothetical protein